MAVKVSRERRFKAVMEAIRAQDRQLLEYVTADVRAMPVLGPDGRPQVDVHGAIVTRDLIPPAPDVGELRGPTWSALARGAAFPRIAETPPDVASTSGDRGGRVTLEPSAGGPAIAARRVGDDVEYAGLHGRILEVLSVRPLRYRLVMQGGAIVSVTEDELQ